MAIKVSRFQIQHYKTMNKGMGRSRKGDDDSDWYLTGFIWRIVLVDIGERQPQTDYSHDGEQATARYSYD